MTLTAEDSHEEKQKSSSLNESRSRSSSSGMQASSDKHNESQLFRRSPRLTGKAAHDFEEDLPAFAALPSDSEPVSAYGSASIRVSDKHVDRGPPPGKGLVTTNLPTIDSSASSGSSVAAAGGSGDSSGKQALPGPLGPWQKAALVGVSPRRRGGKAKEGSDGSMGSSFSDLDGAHVPVSYHPVANTIVKPLAQ